MSFNQYAHYLQQHMLIMRAQSEITKNCNSDANVPVTSHHNRLPPDVSISKTPNICRNRTLLQVKKICNVKQKPQICSDSKAFENNNRREPSLLKARM